jgi:hypothetical protein
MSLPVKIILSPLPIPLLPIMNAPPWIWMISDIVFFIVTDYLVFQTEAKLQRTRRFRWMKMGETEKNGDEDMMQKKKPDNHGFFIALMLYVYFFTKLHWICYGCRSIGSISLIAEIFRCKQC